METATTGNAAIIPSTYGLVPDDLVLEALELARRVNDRLKERTPVAVPRLRETPADEESYRPGELVC